MAAPKERAEKRRQPPATSPEARENQLISLATDLAEKQLIDGSASPSVIAHYLRLGTTREKLEQDKIKLETKLIEARSEALESGKRIEELYSQAIDAMRTYSGDRGGQSDTY
jgi:hypothetical protein